MNKNSSWNLEAGIEEETMKQHWSLTCSLLLSNYLLYTSQAHLPRDVTAHTILSTSLSIRISRNAPPFMGHPSILCMLRVCLVEAIPELRLLLPRFVKLTSKNVITVSLGERLAFIFHWQMSENATGVRLMHSRVQVLVALSTSSQLRIFFQVLPCLILLFLFIWSFVI